MRNILKNSFLKIKNIKPNNSLSLKEIISLKIHQITRNISMQDYILMAKSMSDKNKSFRFKRYKVEILSGMSRGNINIQSNRILFNEDMENLRKIDEYTKYR